MKNIYTEFHVLDILEVDTKLTFYFLKPGTTVL